MGFLRRFRGEDVPEWGDFFSPGEYRAFLDLVRSDFRRRGSTVEIGDGVVRVDGSDDQYGITNLAQLCHANGRADWEGIVAMHFTSLRSIQDRDVDALAADFEQVKPVLRVRLFPDETMGESAMVISTSPDVSRLGSSRPSSTTFPISTLGVHREHLESWPVFEDDVWTIATDNVSWSPSRYGRPSMLTAHRSSSRSGTVSTLRRGCFACQTNCHRGQPTPWRPSDPAPLFTHPIVDASVVSAMTAMLPLVGSMFKEGPGSISDQLYWWRPGELVHLPTQFRRGGVDFSPPEAFVERLNSLAGRNHP